MDEFHAELDGRQLALLELYRDANEPSLDVQERLLARLEARIAIEAEQSGEEPMLPHTETRGSTKAEAKVKPATAVAIAMVAFAAGIVLSWGLRGQVAQLAQERRDPSVAPMTAEPPPPRELAWPRADAEACEAVTIETRVEVPVPIDPPPHGGDAEVADDEAPPSRVFAPSPTPWDEEEEHADDPSSTRSATTVFVPWSTGPDGSSASRPRRDRSPRSRPARSGAAWGGIGYTPARPERPAASGPSGSPGSSSGSGPGGRNGGGKDNGGGKGRGDGRGSGQGDPGDPGGTRPRPPADPGQPPPPPSYPDADEPPPPDDEFPPDTQACDERLFTCQEEAFAWCEQDPIACEDFLYGCDLGWQSCIDPYADPWLECELLVVDCYEQADTMCMPDGEILDPDQCMLLYEECELVYEDCLGALGDAGEDPSF